MFHPVGSKATVCAFTYMPNIVLTGHESGKVGLFDVVSGTETASNERAHMDTVTDLQLSSDRTYFVTSSKDKTARVSLRFAYPIVMALIPPALQATRYQNFTGPQNIFNRDTAQ